VHFDLHASFTTYLSIQTKIRGRLVLLALFVGLHNVLGANVLLNWQSSASTNVTRYNIYFGTNSGNYIYKITVGNVKAATVSNLNCGVTYFFSATALDSRGHESSFSNEAQFLVPGLLTLNTRENIIVPATPVRSTAVAGQSSAKATAGPVSAKAKSSAPLTIKFPVAPQHWYEVQATADFKSWTTIWQTGVATSNAWVQYSDPNASAHSSRYYRLVLH
jgi:hypothetical protein